MKYLMAFCKRFCKPARSSLAICRWPVKQQLFLSIIILLSQTKQLNGSISRRNMPQNSSIKRGDDDVFGMWEQTPSTETKKSIQFSPAGLHWPPTMCKAASSAAVNTQSLRQVHEPFSFPVTGLLWFSCGLLLGRVLGKSQLKHLSNFVLLSQ